MPKRTKQIKRVHVGPLDFITAPRGRALRLFDNRFTQARRARVQAREPVVHEARVTRTDLDRLAANNAAAAQIVDEIRGLFWYHTIDLGNGVRTPGFVDHRAQLPYYGLPESMAGLRCLDVATFDGFWAFEFERRGSTDVVAIDVAKRADIDCPRLMLRDIEAFELTGTMGESFKVAHRLLNSKVDRVERSVYDLDPAVDGMFDVVFISDLLVHLRDPQLAIERAYSVCRGQLIVADVYSPELDALGHVPAAQFLGPGETWWYPNVACLRQFMTVAGFEPVTEVSRFILDSTGGNRIHKAVLRGEPAATPSWTVREKAARAKQAVRQDNVQRS
jgi:tRNA (mo5U34)-methyltransferase